MLRLFKYACKMLGITKLLIGGQVEDRVNGKNYESSIVTMTMAMTMTTKWAYELIVVECLCSINRKSMR